MPNPQTIGNRKSEIGNPQGLSLFTPPAHPDAHHAVRAPGGYEWWYFDAEDPASDTQIVAIFLEGFVFHPGYLRAYARYLRRPTRTPPPMPGDYPCAYFVVYRGGKILAQFMTQVRPEQFEASAAEPRVRIGPSEMTRTGDAYELKLSGTPWKLTAMGPKLLSGQTLAAELRFAPSFAHAPAERTFLSRRMTGAEHRWVIAAPHCRAGGTIRIGNETIEFAGLGYHDHNYGTGPLGPGLKRWIWGRALFEDRVATFQYAVGTRATKRRSDETTEGGARVGEPEIHLLECGADSFAEIPVARAISDWSGLTPLLLRYPRELVFDDALALTAPRLIDSAPFYMRLQYAATFRGRTGTALCEVAYPHRLRWPVLGRMIEMSIAKSG